MLSSQNICSNGKDFEEKLPIPNYKRLLNLSKLFDIYAGMGGKISGLKRLWIHDKRS